MTTNRTTKIAEVLIHDEVEAQPQPAAPVIVSPTTKNAKIKGTWTMYFGSSRWDFVDGRRYDIPLDLFEYLKAHGNIYDTL